MFPVNAKPPDKNLEKIPYNRTLIEMFEDLIEGGLKFFSQKQVVAIFTDSTAIIDGGCKNCQKIYGKRCQCKKIKNVIKLTRKAGEKLKKKMISENTAEQFEKYALSRIRKVIDSIKNMRGNFVTFAEKSSSIFKNETKCQRNRDPVILITGGDGNGNGGGGNLAEIYNPQTNSGCRLPTLPDIRFGHTQDESLLCGGSYNENTQSTCLMWQSKLGNWEETHTMLTRRTSHMSWPSASGVFLIGGIQSGDDWPRIDSFELITKDQVLNSNIR